jgi:acyl-coenzyme A thioesterase PaaI-like protein
MTHCLLSQGIEALTAELNVRFHIPILVGDSVQVIGRLLSQRRGIYLLEATLLVAKQVCVKATGKFIQPKGGVIHRELSV